MLTHKDNTYTLSFDHLKRKSHVVSKRFYIKKVEIPLLIKASFLNVRSQCKVAVPQEGTVPLQFPVSRHMS